MSDASLQPNSVEPVLCIHSVSALAFISWTVTPYSGATTFETSSFSFFIRLSSAGVTISAPAWILAHSLSIHHTRGR